MQTADAEREGAQQVLQHRQQEVRGDALHAAHELELRHLVDQINVLYALDFAAVSLLYRIDSHVARATVGAPALGNRHRRRACAGLAA